MQEGGGVLMYEGGEPFNPLTLRDTVTCAHVVVVVIEYKFNKLLLCF